MPRAVAVPPAGLMGLRDRDDQERPAVLLQRSPDDCLPVPKPRSMDERTPTPAAVAQLAMNDLAAAGASLRLPGSHDGRILRDDFLCAPESRSLLVRIGRNDPPLPLAPLRRIEREEAKLSFGFSLGAHVPPASSSAARRSAAGQREVRRPAAPPVHVLMADHHRPRATRVRIPYAPPSPLATRKPAFLRGQTRRHYRETPGTAYIGAYTRNRSRSDGPVTRRSIAHLPAVPHVKSLEWCWSRFQA